MASLSVTNILLKQIRNLKILETPFYFNIALTKKNPTVHLECKYNYIIYSIVGGI